MNYCDIIYTISWNPSLYLALETPDCTWEKTCHILVDLLQDRLANKFYYGVSAAEDQLSNW